MSESNFNPVLFNHSFFTVKFESKTIKESFKDENDKYSEETIKSHKIHGTFDYEGCTIDDFKNFLKSQTTPVKMYANNVLDGMVEEEILKLASKPIVVKVKKEILGARKSSKANPAVRISKGVEAAKKAGRTNLDIQADLKAELERLEALLAEENPTE